MRADRSRPLPRPVYIDPHPDMDSTTRKLLINLVNSLAMKMPCELIVTHILPTARGALARDLVMSHGMTQTQVAKLFGVTSAAVSQYLKGMRGGNNLIDRSAYKDDFYAEIARMANDIANGADVTESLCGICGFVKDSGLLKALYVFEGYGDELGVCKDCPRFNIVTCDDITSPANL